MEHDVNDPPLGRLFPVGDRRMLLHSAGSGGPAVVIDAGAGMYGLDYLNIQERIGAFTTCVVYDRAGLGWSDPDGESYRSATQVADDLHALLQAAGVSGPYLLVCHSLGGFFARRFTELFPSEVSGIVFIDPAHEDIPVGQQLADTPEVLAHILDAMAQNPNSYRDAFPELYAEQQRWPAGVREPLMARHRDPAHAAYSVRERAGMTRLYEDARAGAGLPDVPVIVLTGAKVDPDSAWMTPEEQRVVLEDMRKAHATLAASVSGGEQRVLGDSAHWIHVERPDAVITAVRDVLARVRSVHDSADD